MQLQPNNGPRGIAAIGSMTAAIKAQRTLAMAGLKVEVIGLSPTETRRGCAYGIEYPLTAEGQVRISLRAARISVAQFLQKGGNAP